LTDQSCGPLISKGHERFEVLSMPIADFVTAGKNMKPVLRGRLLNGYSMSSHVHQHSKPKHGCLDHSWISTVGSISIHKSLSLEHLSWSSPC
jgi:hypothetical protein